MRVPVLEARGIVKRFGHVEALRRADFAVHEGEIVGLIGDNGAGKSTLVKVLSGAMAPDEGEVVLDGAPVRFDSPEDARARGVETVYQDLALATTLGPAANIFLGREILRPGLLGKLGFLDNRAMTARAAESLGSLGVRLRDPDGPVHELSGGQRQSVAISRAARWARRVVFMDEPTAALGVVQTGRVLDLIRRVRDQGVSVVLISHNMPQVVEVCDRVEVLRLGARAAVCAAADTTPAELVAAMTGALDNGDVR